MSEHTQPSVPLTDLMLAMDVVDTLRHRQSVAERELQADVREQELIDKVKATYAAQGIEVSDEIIAEAVKALREERFSYTPPTSGFKTRVAHWYIDRGKWTKRVMGAVAALGLAWGTHYGLVALPGQQTATREATTLTNAAQNAQSQVSDLISRLKTLAADLSHVKPQVPDSLTAVFSRQEEQAKQLLAQAAQRIQAASDAAPTGAITATDVTDGGKTLTVFRAGLKQQTGLLKEANTLLNQAQERIRSLNQLNVLPGGLEQLRNEVRSVSQDPQANTLTDQYYQDALAAMAQGDFARAQQRSSDLKDLLAALQRTYTLEIVSRPGERTGVWRYPEANTGARNYYLIVEAVTDNGERLTLPVTSEEDGKVYTVDRWGMRVDQSVYERVGADKQDDGIVQDNTFGVKRRGFLRPEYQMGTTGAAITQW